MPFLRAQRVSSLIQERMGWILEREIELPGALITITGVNVRKKLEEARVMVTVFPSEKAAETLNLLGRRAPYLEHLLIEQIHIKPMPKIVFELDRGPENAARIEKALLEDNNKLGTRD